MATFFERFLPGPATTLIAAFGISLIAPPTALLCLFVASVSAATPSFADFDRRAKAVERLNVVFFGALIKKGVGFGCMHYGVEVLPDKGGPEFQKWIGGFYENQFSCKHFGPVGAITQKEGLVSQKTPHFYHSQNG